MQARIGVNVVDDFPDVEDGITLPTSLKAVKFEMLKSVNVISVSRKSGGYNLPQKVRLN